MTKLMTSETESVRDRQSLWPLIVSPTIWAAHFLLSYITAAIWCAKFAGPEVSAGPVRGAIVFYTLVAVVGIAANGWSGYRKHRLGDATVPHDADSAEDSHRFLGFAALLLSGLSFVATIFSLLAVVFIWNCH
jgi:hypothetical protein